MLPAVPLTVPPTLGRSQAGLCLAGSQEPEETAALHTGGGREACSCLLRRHRVVPELGLVSDLAQGGRCAGLALVVAETICSIFIFSALLHVLG